MINTENRAHEHILKMHPCFSKEAHHKFGRIHLPVAPACNIQCKYCVRKYDCANESRPGITSTVLSAGEALERIRLLIDRNDNITVIGIAGPGDPLANEATFEVLGAINREFPEIILCVSTNGLFLPARLTDLLGSGVRSLTVTINAVSPDTAEKIYSWIVYNGRRFKGREAADYLLFNQQIGLRDAVEAGLIVKVNTVFIPGINDEDIPHIAALAGEKGAHIMNIIPLIPQAELAHLQRPSHEMIGRMRRECSKYILQMTHCRQCRADAFGVLGEDGDMELAVLNSRMGEEYCENVR
ncbi:MAG: radical SAM protein [Nitrospirota bacterium]